MSLWTITAYTQSTPALCWEATGRMMWHWRFKNLNGYNTKAGRYLSMNTGLTEAEMDAFYKQLGMRSLMGPRGVNLRHALGWSPVIFTDVDQTAGHAMVLAGFNGENYTVVNPCAVQNVDFDAGSNVCASGTILRTRVEVEQPLGKYMWYW